MIERDGDVNPWAPDSGASFERPPPSTDSRAAPGVVGQTPFPSGSGDHDAPLPRPVRGDRRTTAVAVVIAAAALVGSVLAVLGRGGDDDGGSAQVSSSTTAPPITLPAPTRTLDELAQPAVLVDTGADVVLGRVDVPLARLDGTCAPPRLPGVLDERWSTAVDVGAVRVGRPVVLESTLLFAARRGPDAPIELLAIDTVDGRERWRIDLGSAPAVANAIQVIDGVAVVAFTQLAQRQESLLGVDLASGERLWTTALTDDQQLVAEADAPWVVVDERTDRGAARNAVALLAGASGEMIQEAEGRFVGVVAGETVVAGEEGLIVIGDPDETGVRRRIPWSSADIRDAVVVGGSVVVVDEDHALARLVLGRDAGLEPLELRGVAGIDPPAQIASLRPLGDSSLLVISGDAVHGGNLDRSSVELRWRRAGQLQDESPSDRGRTITVGDLETPYHRVVDASTGRIVFERPYGAAAAVEPVANGIIVQNVDTAGGWSYDARDIDGRRRWRLEGPDFLAVGDRYVVTGEVAGDGVFLTAIGESSGDEALCGSVMREWVES